MLQSQGSAQVCVSRPALGNRRLVDDDRIFQEMRFEQGKRSQQVTVNEMIGTGIALVYKWIVHFYGADFRIPLPERRQMGIVLPQGIGRGPDVDDKFSGVGFLQVSDRRGQHHNVARTLKRAENQVMHGLRTGTLTRAAQEDTDCRIGNPACREGKSTPRPRPRAGGLTA